MNMNQTNKNNKLEEENSTEKGFDPFARRGLVRSPAKERAKSTSDVLDKAKKEKEKSAAHAAERQESANPVKATQAQRVHCDGLRTLWEDIQKGEAEEALIIKVLESKLLEINKITSEANNMHKTVKGGMAVAVLQLKRLICSRKENSAKKATFKADLDAACQLSLEKEAMLEECSEPSRSAKNSLLAGTSRKRTAPESPEETAKRDTKKRLLQNASETGEMPQVDKTKDKNGDRKETEWKEVVHRKELKKKKARAEGKDDSKQVLTKKRKTSCAIKVCANEGTSYADILRHMRSTVNPGEAEITSIRRTRKGELLLVVKADSDYRKFSQAVTESLKDRAEVKELANLTTLEIKDIDETVTQEEAATAINEALGEGSIGKEVSVRLMRGYGQMQVALVNLPERQAEAILQAGKIKIGWVNCRVKKRLEVIQCYRCLCYGHRAAACKGPDRKALCWKCSSRGHKFKYCTQTALCLVCKDGGEEEIDHVPGRKGCASYLKELAKVRDRK